MRGTTPRLYLSLSILFALACTISKASANSVLYMAERGTDALSTVDIGSGTPTLVGPLGIDLQFIGMAYDPVTDRLLMTNSTSSSPSTVLYSVDPDTGSAISIGDTGVNFLSGLTYDPNAGVLYGTTGNTDSLYRINPSTAAVTVVGGFGLNANVSGLAFDPNANVLYMNEINSDALYRIDTQSGAATIIGGNGGNFNVLSLAFDATTDTLYSTGGISDQLATINTQTGAATPIGSLGFDSMNAGLAFRVTAVPEPSACFVLAFSMGLICLRRRGRSAARVGATHLRETERSEP